MDREKITKHLIKKDFINKYYNHAFMALGFDMSFFTLNIDDIIFELAGFQKTPDWLYARYNDQLDLALRETNHWNFGDMQDKWPPRIFDWLMGMRQNHNLPEVLVLELGCQQF